MKIALALWLRAFALACLVFVCAANAAVDVSGGSSQSPTDITALVLANQDINFTGGDYIVLLPRSGVGLVEAQIADAPLTTNGSTRTGNVGFSSKDNPTIVYTGVLSGNGVLTVRSAFNPQRPAAGQLFTGGVLMFANPVGQTWGLEGVASGARNAAALVVETNATVSFFFPGRLDAPAPPPNDKPLSNVFETSATKSRNIVNDGYIYSSARNRWASITGTGVTVFTWWGGDAGQLSSGSVYTGERFITANGLQIPQGANFEDQAGGQRTLVVAADITVFQNGASQWLTVPSSFKVGDAVNKFAQNISFWALNIQLWARGIYQFTGVALPPAGSRSYLDTSPLQESVKAMYSYGSGSGSGFGRVFNLNNRITFLMGDGSEIITNTDGITNNVFLQGNPFNSLLSVANFESGPLGGENQAVAYNYSGTYRINHNLNASTDNNNGVINGIRNGDWVHLLFLNPKEWNSSASQPNHAIVTVPVFFAGLTRIDNNAILQLGDGTQGNDILSRAVNVNGTVLTSRYNDSMGNGTLMTQGNEAMLPKLTGMNASVVFEIVNNGKLVVNNTVGSLSGSEPLNGKAGSSAAVAAWVNANQLDGISGTGSVEQKGSLPLTLGATGGNPNTYTGGTMIRDGSTLIVASEKALGARDATGQGNVLNNGTLRTATGIRVIRIEGDYIQVAAAISAEANSRAP